MYIMIVNRYFKYGLKHGLLFSDFYYVEQILLKPLIELIFQLSFKKAMDIYYYHNYNIVLTKYA